MTTQLTMNSPCFGHSPWGPPAAARSELVRSGVSEGAMVELGLPWATRSAWRRRPAVHTDQKKGLVDMGE